MIHKLINIHSNAISIKLPKMHSSVAPKGIASGCPRRNACSRPAILPAAIRSSPATVLDRRHECIIRSKRTMRHRPRAQVDDDPPQWPDDELVTQEEIDAILEASSAAKEEK